MANGKHLPGDELRPEVAVADGGTARITAVSAELLAVPLDRQLRAYGSGVVNVVRVIIADSDGARATGFTYTLGLGAVVVCRMVEEVIAPALIGLRTSDWNRQRDQLSNGTRRLGRSVFVPALSAVDIAIWDLRGLQADQPLYALLGGSSGAVPIYGSGRGSNSLELDELVQHTLDYLRDGYPAVKVRAGARSVEDDLHRLRSVREAVGDQVRLMVDCNEQLDLTGALWLGRRLAELGYYWLEEPLIAEDLDGHAVLAAQLEVPIAVGEHLVGRHEFAQHLRATSIGLYQPDAALTGGVTEAQRIAQLAVAHNRSISYHSLPELHIHLAVQTPNVSYVEDFGILDAVLADSLTPHNGTVVPPERSGHGMAWDEDAIRRFSRPI
ncbi:L-alanine-DL-glutamate epimerase-like enolase superfamily enzyme [Kribbella sp. VKM Ac-2568]|nr:L-alanine-DL-glutamate epimerase-like enolase superfamily enzyme [Kribbella sp. VKM Ac-2568]